MDPDALVRAYGSVVWSLCRRLDPEPEDAYQHVWERVLTRVHRFDPAGSGSFAAWLRTVTRRLLIDRYRRRAVRGPVVEPRDLADTPVAVDDALDAHSRRQRLEEAVTRLPPDQRRCVVLHHIEGLSLEDIAKLEGAPLGTIKSRLHRGRARLATLLGGR
jgi:RNA polymerase sigma-70 factor (ECF subfamily)